MASILELVYETSSELKDRAREASGVKVSQTKDELIKDLADEEATNEVEDILSYNTKKLKDETGNSSGLKAEMRETLLAQLFGNASGGGGSAEASSESMSPVWPARKSDGVPRQDLSSHFETVTNRRKAISSACEEALEKALDEQQSYVVLESLRPKDHNDPIKMQPAYMKRHPDQILVFEARVPMSPYPVQNADRNPIRI